MAPPKAFAIEGQLKRCTTCSEDKPLEAFAKSKGGKFGRHSRCRACFKAMDAEKYRRQAVGVTHRDGCMQPSACSSKSHKLCKKCSEKGRWLSERGDVLLTGVKHCHKCGNDKPLSDFPVDATRPLGVAPTCKDCGAAQKRKRIASDPDLAERLRGENRAFYKLDTEFKIKKYEERRRRYNTDEEYRLAIVERARTYRALRRADEEFDAFMERMEAEAAEYEAANKDE